MPDIDNLKLSRWSVGLSLALASALLRLWAFAQTDFANGWDSYFYLVQLKSLETTGRMHSPEASLIYPYLGLFYRFTGDYVWSLKIGSALLCGLWTGVVWWMSAPLAPDRAGLRPVLGAWSVFSPQLTYFAAQYPKNLLGVLLLAAFMASLRQLPASRGPVRTWLLPLSLLALNYFGHRLTFALALMYGALWALFRSGHPFRSLLLSRNALLAAVTGLVALLAAGRFFPGLLHWADLGRLDGTLSASPQFAPVSFVIQFGPERVSGWWLAEIVLVTGYWLAFTGFRVGMGSGLPGRRNFRWPFVLHNSGFPLLLWGALLLFPFLEWSFTGISYRFFLVFLVVGPLLAIDNSATLNRQTGLIFAGLILCCSFFSWKTYDPDRHDPDYTRFAHLTENAQKIVRTEKPALVIAHNSLAEFFTFTTGMDAMPWLPEYPVDSARLWRIAAGIHGQTLKYYVGSEYESAVHSLGYGYYLLPEYVWQAAIRRAEAERDVDFLTEARGWLNPWRMRPGWLLQRKRES